jgi:hypothetical protein
MLIVEGFTAPHNFSRISSLAENVSGGIEAKEP